MQNKVETKWHLLTLQRVLTYEIRSDASGVLFNVRDDVPPQIGPESGSRAGKQLNK